MGRSARWRAQTTPLAMARARFVRARASSSAWKCDVPKMCSRSRNDLSMELRFSLNKASGTNAYPSLRMHVHHRQLFGLHGWTRPGQCVDLMLHHELVLRGVSGLAHQPRNYSTEVLDRKIQGVRRLPHEALLRCHSQNCLGICARNGQQGTCGTARLLAPLLPPLQRANRHSQERRKL